MMADRRCPTEHADDEGDDGAIDLFHRLWPERSLNERSEIHSRAVAFVFL